MRALSIFIKTEPIQNITPDLKVSYRRHKNISLIRRIAFIRLRTTVVVSDFTLSRVEITLCDMEIFSIEGGPQK